MTLRYESAEQADEARLAEDLRSICGLRGEAEHVAPGDLPNDGVVIEDARTYD